MEHCNLLAHRLYNLRVVFGFGFTLRCNAFKGVKLKVTFLNTERGKVSVPNRIHRLSPRIGHIYFSIRTEFHENAGLAISSDLINRSHTGNFSNQEGGAVCNICGSRRMARVSGQNGKRIFSEPVCVSNPVATPSLSKNIIERLASKYCKCLCHVSLLFDLIHVQYFYVILS